MPSHEATSLTEPAKDTTALADAALRILLLEDVATDAELVKRELRREELDFTARRVAKRDAFVEALHDFAPDIILADYSLPSFDGLTALQLAQEHRPDVPVVFLSGAIGEERAIETLRQGATDYVLKDRLSRLGPAVRRALREAALRRAHREAALRRAHDELEQKVKARTAALRESQERSYGHHRRGHRCHHQHRCRPGGDAFQRSGRKDLSLRRGRRAGRLHRAAAHAGV